MVDVTFTNVDFGTVAGGDDNDPYDIFLDTDDFHYWYDDGETFTCDSERCGTETTASISANTNSSTTENVARGHVFLAEAQGTLDDVAFYLGTLGGTGCELDYFVLSAADPTDPTWTVEWIESMTLASTADDWVASSPIGLPVEVGTYYAIGFGADCSATGDQLRYTYASMGSSTSDMGVGTTVGRWVTNYDGYGAAGATVDTSFSSSNFRYYSELGWSH